MSAIKIKSGNTWAQIDSIVINNNNVVQQSGTSITDVMSQSAVTSALTDLDERKLDASAYTADEEDLTFVNVEGTDVLKFKDKEYNPLVYSGLGRKILRKNMVNGVNTLTQSMISDANTIYVIQYDFTLGEDITVPENCVLEFDGGSINNGVIDINGAYIYPSYNCLLNGNNIEVRGVPFKGTFRHNTIPSWYGTGMWWEAGRFVTPQMFGAKCDGETDDSTAIINMYNYAVQNDSVVFFPCGDYISSTPFAPLSKTITVISPKATFSCSRPIFASYTFNINGVEDAKIYFNNAFVDGNNARSHIINISNSVNVELHDINIAHVAADSPSGADHDGIYVGGNSHDIKIVGGNIKDVNRNGITITDAYNVVAENVSIEGVGWVPNPTNPSTYLGTVASGIDVEPNNMAICHNIVIKDCNIKHCRRGGITIEQGVVGIQVINNILDDVPNGVACGFGGSANHSYRIGLDKYYVKAYDSNTGEITIEVANGYEINPLTYAIFSAGDDAQHMDSKPTELNTVSHCYVWEITPISNSNQVKIKIKPRGGFLKDNVINSFTNVPEVLQYSYICITNSAWTSGVVIENNKITNLKSTTSIPKSQAMGINTLYVPAVKIINNTIKDFDGGASIKVQGTFALIQGNHFYNINGAGIGANMYVEGNNPKLINNIIENSNGYPFYITSYVSAYISGLFGTSLVNNSTVANTDRILRLFSGSCIFLENAYLQSDRELQYGIQKDAAVTVKLKNVDIISNLTEASKKYFNINSDDLELCISIPTNGLFANKPTEAANNIPIGFKYFCTDRKIDMDSSSQTYMQIITPVSPDTGGMEINYKGNNVWVDAFGRVVS